MVTFEVNDELQYERAGHLGHGRLQRKRRLYPTAYITSEIVASNILIRSRR